MLDPKEHYFGGRDFLQRLFFGSNFFPIHLFKFSSSVKQYKNKLDKQKLHNTVYWQTEINGQNGGDMDRVNKMVHYWQRWHHIDSYVGER
jgi:hypothetical protein